MRNPSTTTGEQLANALYALGVRFVMDGTNAEESLHKEPTRLIAALAESNEARLRLSLIPLFLEYPEFAAHVRAAARGLSAPARVTLRCYYSAAVWLQRKYRLRLDALLGQNHPCLIISQANWNCLSRTMPKKICGFWRNAIKP